MTVDIRFFSDGISFKLEDKRKISKWLKQVVIKERKKTGMLHYIFVSDETILDMNNKYLHHNEYTDIITFDKNEADLISGEMYISIDSVRENAKEYHVNFRNELLRVMVHGVLHLCGYNDKTCIEQKEMRELEEEYLKHI